MADEARIRLGNFALAQTPSNTPSEGTAEAGATLTAGLQLPATKDFDVDASKHLILQCRAHIASSSARSRAAINRPWVNGDAFRLSIRKLLGGLSPSGEARYDTRGSSVSIAGRDASGSERAPGMRHAEGGQPGVHRRSTLKFFSAT